MNLTREQAENRRKRGFGVGEGAGYTPWLVAKEVPSQGKTWLVPGWKTGRTHTLLSGLERKAFFVLQRQPGVLDIREQYPLWPPERTREIADALGVRHPGAGRAACFVVTVDLFVTRRTEDGSRVFEALAVKPTELLNRADVQEKLTLELEYFNETGVPWRVLTEEEVDTSYAWNVEWMDEHHDLDDPAMGPGAVLAVEQWLRAELDRYGGQPIHRMCAAADGALGLPTGTALTVLRHLLSRKRLHVPLSRKIDTGEPLARPCVFARS